MITPITAHIEATATVLADVAAERKRQDDKWGVQRHPLYIYDPEVELTASRECNRARNECDRVARAGALTWSHILQEEHAEAIVEAFKGDRAALRKEMVQLAAVLIASIESLDAGCPLTDEPTA